MNTVGKKHWDLVIGQESMALLLDSVLCSVLLPFEAEASSVLGRLDSGGLHTGSLEGDGLSGEKKIIESFSLHLYTQ